MELALFTRGFQHNLKMRLATEIQGDEASQENLYRGAQDASHRSNETTSRPSRRSPEIPQHFALAAQATNDALRVWTVTTGALDWSQGLDSLLGYTASPATDEIGFWQKQLHPQDRARAAASIRDALVTDAHHWTGEYRFRHLDGSYLDLLERAYIVRDRLGRAVQWVGSLMNITARKQLQDQLVRSQKMEAFGQLAGGVAHDFNNFLTTILGYSDLLLDELETKGEIASHIREIRGAAARASAICKMSTPVLTRLLQEAVQHQSPKRAGAFRPKLRYAHQGGMNPPVVVIHGNSLEHVTDSYKRYLEGRIRAHFKLTGTPLRIEMRSSKNPFVEGRS